MTSLVKILLLSASLLFIYVGSCTELWRYFADENWVLSYIESAGITGILFVLIFGVVFTALGGPRQLIALLFGLVFGAVGGILLTLLVCIISAVSVYASARYVVRATVHHRYSLKLHKFNKLVEHDPFIKILMLRLLPVGSNLLTNLFAGGVDIRLSAFFWASLLGYIPQTLIFALGGAGVGDADTFQLTLSIALGVISMALGSWLYRSHLQRKVEEIIEPSSP